MSKFAQEVGGDKERGAVGAHRTWNRHEKVDRSEIDVEALFDYQSVKGLKGFARAEASDAQIKAKLAENEFNDEIEKYVASGDIDPNSNVPLVRQLKRIKEKEEGNAEKLEAERQKQLEQEMKEAAAARKAAKKKDPAERKKEAEERRARLKAAKEAKAAGGDAAVDEAADALEKVNLDD